MLILKKLRFKNIGRFIEEQEINFEELSNIIQIDGINNNTGGSSGAGKSTIFNSLDFLLGLNSISNSMLQSRLTDDSIFVEGEFDLDGQNLIISRGKKLKITLDGETTTGSSKISEEKLDSILSISRDLFRPMLHKKQREPGFFLSLTPSEINSFLTDCLGLTDYKKYIENIDLKYSELAKKRDELSLKLNGLKHGFEASKKALESIGPKPEKDVDQSTILSVKELKDKSEKQLNDILQKHKEEWNALENNKPTIDNSDFESILLKEYQENNLNILRALSAIELEESEFKSKIRTDILEIQSKKKELQRTIDNAKNAQEEINNLSKEIIKIRKNICPRCDQNWITDSVKSEEEKLVSKIISLRPLVLNLEPSLAEMSVLIDREKQISEIPTFKVSEKNELQEKLNNIKNLMEQEKQKQLLYKREQNLKNNSLLEEFSLSQKKLREKHSNELEAIRGQLEIHKKTLDVAVNKLKFYEAMVEKHESSKLLLTEDVSSYEEKINITDGELQLINSDLIDLEELKKAIKSYLSCSFDEALEIISENATKTIQNIPNMATATIQLEGTRETKEGKIKEEVNALLHVDGEENVPIKTLSGGERASVDLAIDIAVLDLIEERSGKGCNVYILDEPFTGLDSANIEMVLEVLKNTNSHKKLIIVDHNPVVKEQISDRITVVRDGLTSSINKR